MTNTKSLLPEALKQKVDAAVEASISKSFNLDPIFGQELSYILSLLSSLQRKDGLLLQESLKEALKRNPHFTILPTEGFKVSTAAARLTETNPEEIKDTPDLLYTGTGQPIQIDLAFIDHRTNTAWATEIKRANGQLDSQKSKSVIRTCKAAGMLIKSYAEQLGYHVTSGDSKIIAYYGKSNLPTDMTLSKDDLNDHFGYQITDIVEATTDYLRKKITQALPDNLKHLTVQ